MNSISLSLRFSQWPNTFPNTLNSRFLSPNTFPQIFSVTKQKEILEREPGWNRSSPFHSFPCHLISPKNVSALTPNKLVFKQKEKRTTLIRATIEATQNDENSLSQSQPQLQTLSKNAQKKLLKQQRYEAKKAEKKVHWGSVLALSPANLVMFLRMFLTSLITFLTSLFVSLSLSLSLSNTLFGCWEM